MQLKIKYILIVIKINKWIVFVPMLLGVVACTRQNPAFTYVKGTPYTIEELNIKVITAFISKNYKDCKDTCRFKINSNLAFKSRMFHYFGNYKREFYKNGYSLSGTVELGRSVEIIKRGIGEIYFGGDGLKKAFTFSPVVYFSDQHYFYMECVDNKGEFTRFTGMILGDRIFIDESCDVGECMDLPNDMKGDLKSVKIEPHDDSI